MTSSKQSSSNSRDTYYRPTKQNNIPMYNLEDAIKLLPEIKNTKVPDRLVHDWMVLGWHDDFEKGSKDAEQMLRWYELQSPLHLMHSNFVKTWRNDDIFWEEMYQHVINRYIVELITNPKRRMFINTLPIQHGKTNLATIATVIWYYLKYPNTKNLVATYSEDRAKDLSHLIFDMFQKHANIHGYTMKSKPSTMSFRFNESPPQAGIKISSAQKGIFGMTISGLAIIDDPVDHKKFDSINEHERVKSAVGAVIGGRMKKKMTEEQTGAKLLLNASRLHTEDLPGHLIENQGWNKDSRGRLLKNPRTMIVNFPAMAMDKDPLGRKPGTSLSQHMKNKQELIIMKEGMKEWEWMAMCQGVPGNIAKNLFHTDKIWDECEAVNFSLNAYEEKKCDFIVPRRYSFEERMSLTKSSGVFNNPDETITLSSIGDPAHGNCYMFIDQAYGKGEDSTGVVVGWAFYHPDSEPWERKSGYDSFIILDVFELKTSPAQQKDFLIEYIKRFPLRLYHVYVEGLTLDRDIKALNPYTYTLSNQRKSKLNRAEDLRNVMERGHIYTCQNFMIDNPYQEWFPKLRRQLLNFTEKQEHDDLVDALAYFVAVMKVKRSQELHDKWAKETLI